MTDKIANPATLCKVYNRDSQKGLDLDLLLFRICEISINRGFTNEQTSQLINRVIDLWNREQGDKNLLKRRGSDEVTIRLQAEVEKLLRFPDGVPDSSIPPALTEKMLVNKLPRRLFDLLMNYNDQVVMGVPKIGSALHSHMKSYYQFRQKVLRLEDALTTRIGQIVKVPYREAWRIYLKYVIMRFDGQSKDSIIAAGDFLNYDITWDDAERVFSQLSSEPPIPHEISELFALHKDMIDHVSKISSAI